MSSYTLNKHTHTLSNIILTTLAVTRPHAAAPELQGPQEEEDGLPSPHFGCLY